MNTIGRKRKPPRARMSVDAQLRLGRSAQSSLLHVKRECATAEKDVAAKKKEIRRLRKMLRLIVNAGHYNPGKPCCAACDATAEVFSWK